MVTCPHGHPNPPGWTLCGECGAPIEQPDVESTAWYRTKWALVGAGVVAVLVIVAAAAALVMDNRGDRADSADVTTARQQEMSQWWGDVRAPFTDLQDSLADSQRAVQEADSDALEQACQRMHDSSAVELQSHLPAPDADLTSEVAAAADDAHAAAHMCLSVTAGSTNAYDGEFTVNLQQAEQHLRRAR